MKDSLDVVVMTPNQVVAYNLRRARQLRKWTQEKAAEELEPHLGGRWSKATWSAAERSLTGERVRQFTADDLVAFAQGFDLPLSWFLIPPTPGDGVDGIPVLPEPALATPETLLHVLFDDHESTVRNRVSEVVDWLPEDLHFDLNAAAEAWADMNVTLHLKSRLSGIEGLAESLSDLAGVLEEIRSETVETITAEHTKVIRQIMGGSEE